MDTPLAEAGIIGTASAWRSMASGRAGDPVRRLHLPAFDQIVNELAKFRYRRAGNIPRRW